MVGLTAALATASCGLPRSGPTKRQIGSGSVIRQGDAFIVKVDDSVVRATAVQPALGFSTGLINADELRPDRIRPGDTLSLTIWENVDDGLLASQGMSATQLDNIQVDGRGYIFVPYAGRIKAADNTPNALREVITSRLESQTPDPQVLVARVAGDGTTVSVMGAVNGQGVFPIERSTSTLSEMLSKAGGVSIPPEIAKVTLKRGNLSESIWLEDLYENPKMDIALRNGDKILVEKDQGAFTSLGATGSQARVPFEVRPLSALEAIATVGGLQTNLADPTGIFVFRDEPANIANQVLGRTDLVEDQRMIYVLDLTGPSGMFLARGFVIRDGDTVYVTEAPFVEWQKTLSALTSPLSTASAINNVAN